MTSGARPDLRRRAGRTPDERPANDGGQVDNPSLTCGDSFAIMAVALLA